MNHRDLDALDQLRLAGDADLVVGESPLFGAFVDEQRSHGEREVLVVDYLGGGEVLRVDVRWLNDCRGGGGASEKESEPDHQ